MPSYVSYRAALKYLESKMIWIRDTMLKMESKIENSKIIRIHDLQENRAKAKRSLIERLNVLSTQIKFPFNKVSIRSQKTRWGSCSGRNNINLNINLVQLPEELRDYVILHELTHTKVKNHSKDFWNTLSQILPQAKLLDKKLSAYKISN